jgi:AcrR family transcriptional regulator
MSSPQQRILDAAMSCFASKGYAATTMADIETAAGLTPGAGGTYRHFASKQAILEAAIDALLAQDDAVLAPAPASLTAAARDVLAEFDWLRPLTQLLFRDLDQFPELLERVVARLVQGPYRLVAERIAAVAPSVDAEALAVLLVGGLINFKVIETLVGPGRGGVSEDRLVDAWEQLYALVLKQGAPRRERH